MNDELSKWQLDDRAAGALMFGLTALLDVRMCSLWPVFRALASCEKYLISTNAHRYVV